MTATVLLSFFAGMIVGLRLKVPALVLATICAGILAYAIVESGVAAITAILAIQLGYLCSTFAAALREAPVTTETSSVVAIAAPAQSVSSGLPINR